jgi:hypothetical protein
MIEEEGVLLLPLIAAEIMISLLAAVSGKRSVRERIR